MTRKLDIVGLIPAAGYGSRISHILKGSKEIYPIKDKGVKTRPVSSYLMESMKIAGATKSFMVLRNGKWDIPEYYKDGSSFDMKIAYLVVEETQGVPYTIDSAYPFIKGNRVLLGFPDILLSPANAFVSLLEKQNATGADLVLGLFKTAKPQKSDMVVFNGDGQLKDIDIKPKETNLIYTWIIAAWSPVFSVFLHGFVAKNKNYKDGELHIGDVVREAIKRGLKTEYVKFDEGCFLDIGTPADLKKVSSGDWRADSNFSE